MLFIYITSLVIVYTFGIEVIQKYWKVIISYFLMVWRIFTFTSLHRLIIIFYSSSSHQKCDLKVFLSSTQASESQWIVCGSWIGSKNIVKKQPHKEDQMGQKCTILIRIYRFSGRHACDNYTFYTHDFTHIFVYFNLWWRRIGGKGLYPPWRRHQIHCMSPNQPRFSFTVVSYRKIAVKRLTKPVETGCHFSKPGFCTPWSSCLIVFIKLSPSAIKNSWPLIALLSLPSLQNNAPFPPIMIALAIEEQFYKTHFWQNFCGLFLFKLLNTSAFWSSSSISPTKQSCLFFVF